jgi:pimeloyl-ACP methyl ester carboxylesterase
LRVHRVEGHGGVTLQVADHGPADAPAILLIHGWSQHSLSWSKQIAGPLAERFRLIAPDLRGHGASDKPAEPSAYDNPAPWAGDVAAIIAALGLERPLLLGWSMGGWVCCDYLRLHGDDGIAGLVLVGSTARSGALANPSPAAKRSPEVRAEGMYSDDHAAALEATIAFVQACFAQPLSAHDLAFMVGFNMLVPPHARGPSRLRARDDRDVMAALRKPALVIQGAEERLVLPPVFEEVVAALPDPSVAVYEGCGHAPFWEAPDRFDADLAAFADHCFRSAA